MLLAWLTAATTLHAQHRLDTVKVSVMLFPDGHAYVREVRVMDIGNEGTECYIAFHNMDDMSVELVGVSDESGREYVVEQPWDVDRSREDKAGRCGMVVPKRESDGHDSWELCWGVGSSGPHKYTVRYNLYGLVKSYEEADGFNHSFYEAAQPPARYGAVYVMTYSRQFPIDTLRLTPETARVWGFGYHGEVRFAAGGVAAYSQEPLVQGDGIIVMMEFPKGIFSPTVRADKPFSQVKELAFEGSDYNLEDSLDGSGQMASLTGAGKMERAAADDITAEDILDTMLGLLCCCGSPVVLLLAYLAMHRRERRRRDELKRRERDLPYVTDPPAKSSLVRSQLIVLASLRLFGTGTRCQVISQRELLQAFVLRMLYTGRLKLILDTATGSKKVAFEVADPAGYSQSEEVMQTDEYSDLLTPIERKLMRRYASEAGTALNDAALIHSLHTLLYDAAGDDDILQPSELRTYIKTEQHQLQMGPYARLISSFYHYEPDEKCVPQEEINEVYGFFKYLRDFTLMPERHIQEVALWQEFMVFAALYDLTEQVGKDLKRINPDLANLDDITQRYLARPVQEAVTSFANALDDSINTSRKHYYDALGLVRDYDSSSSGGSGGSSRSSGGGGSSSYRGGGGHSGGGGSGVR